MVAIIQKDVLSSLLKNCYPTKEDDSKIKKFT